MALKGEKHHKSILKESQVLEIKRLRFKEGKTYPELMKIFKIPKSTIVHVCLGYNWGWLKNN